MVESKQEIYVTMTAGSGCSGGAVCKMTADGTVGPCAEGDIFCGVIGTVREGYCGVLLRGFVTVDYSGDTAPEVGFCTLAADGEGGVCEDEDGKEYLVCAVNETEKTLLILL